MRIIRDTDTVEFTDESGDKLVLLVAPRQRDVEASDEIEREDAMEQLDRLKKSGLDTEAIMAEAEKDPDALAKARENAADAPAAAKVREFRLKALGIKLVITGDSIGGEQIIASYKDMDPVSAGWVDSCVDRTWKKAIPTAADTQGKGADDDVSTRATISATP